MARPNKNNAEYFSHDSDMRNDEKILAVRRKFGIEGYGVFCMILEKLTDCEEWKLSYSEINIELWSGDFGVEAGTLKEIIEYFLKLGLLILENDQLVSQGLIKRFQPLLEKREREKQKAKTRVRDGTGKFLPRTPPSTTSVDTSTHERGEGRGDNDQALGVSATEMPQSKVKKSKVKKSKVNILSNDNIYKQVFDFWNLQNVTVHKNISDPIKSKIDKRLKQYTLEEILKSIETYAEIFKSPQTYFKHKWTLEEFLRRENAMPVFLCKTIDDYLEHRKTARTPANALMDDKKDYLAGIESLGIDPNKVEIF